VIPSYNSSCEINALVSPRAPFLPKTAGFAAAVTAKKKKDVQTLPLRHFGAHINLLYLFFPVVFSFVNLVPDNNNNIKEQTITGEKLNPSQTPKYHNT
jgi:hypothetical protein